ncbi:VWA domain-containing protein [Parahaliea aestuarii]|uniref:VWA domain-containing protein n=1 Tax=Parahaliea aestuarii TaxID=1852021 RepID=A0A5C9A1W5_9GAMM|nr:VWA domain-containing protein [Parahaliea aestuarii]
MRPQWLWALLPALLLALGLLAARRRSGSWSSVIDPELLPYLVSSSSGNKRRNALPWLLLAWLLACVALAGPSLHKIPQPVAQREDALVVILDLSYSMKAADLAPSRLDRARQKILDLLDVREEGQTALVAFAGDAHVVTPLTDDKATIANLLPALNPDMMPVPGSDAAGAVSLALQLLHSGGARDGRILLLTDAVARDQHDTIADAVADAGVELDVMGIGTASGAPLPLPEGGFLKDASGTIVVPGLDSAELSQLARKSRGRYLTMQLDNSDLQDIATALDLPGQERLSTSERRADHWEDQGYVLVLLLLPAALLLFRRGVLLGLLALLWLGEPAPAQAQAWDDLWLTPDQQGQRALRAGDAEKASELFDSAPWAGTAAYEAGNFEGAARHFAEGDSADDWYNRGNALARAGQLDQAIEAYRESLARAPDQADAQANLELLEQLKQQQEQQQDQQEQSQDGEQQEQQQQEQSQNGEQQNQGDQQQQQPGADQEQEQSQPGEEESQQQRNKQPGEPEQAEEQPQQPQGSQPQEEAADSTEQQAAAAEPSTEQTERDQALEQWLRRVPDDPSGLLREKFRYESRQRQQQGEAPRDDQNW